MRRLFVLMVVILVAALAFASYYFAYMTNPEIEKDLARAKQLASERHTNSEAAENLFEKCMKVASKSHNKSDLYVVQVAYASFLSDNHRYDEAIEILSSAALIAASLENYVNESRCVEKIAQCKHSKFWEEGVVPDQATIQRANSLIERLTGKFSAVDRAHINISLGCIYSDIGEYDKADDCFKTATDLVPDLDKNSSIPTQITLLKEQMKSAVLRKKYAQANQFFIDAYHLCSKASPENVRHLQNDLVLEFRHSLKCNSLSEAGIWPRLGQLFRSGKLNELDKEINAIRASKKVCADGGWLLDDVYKQTTLSILDSDEHWSRHIQNLRIWVMNSPDSDNAKIALAENLSTWALKARGHGGATEERTTPMERRSMEAWKVLHEVKERTPDWYSAAMHAGLARRASIDVFVMLFVECHKKYPDYDDIVFQMSYFLLPTINGRPGNTASWLAREVTKRSSPQNDILYARTVGYLDRLDGNPLTETPPMNWKRTKKGYFLLFRENYSDIYTTEGDLSILALKVGDEETSKRAFL